MKLFPKTLLQKSFFLVLLRGFTSLFNALSTILLARNLGAENYGQISIVVAYLAFFQIFAIFGIDHILIREVAKTADNQNAIFGTALSICIFLSFASLIPAILFLSLVNYPAEIKQFIVVCSLNLLFSSATLLSGLFQAHLKVFYPAISGLLVAILLFLLNLVFIKNQLPLICFAFTQTVFIFFQGLVLLLFVKKIPGFSFVLNFDLKIAKMLLTASFPLVISALCAFLNLRLDQFLIFTLLDGSKVGLYSAISRLTEGLNIIPMAVSSLIYPLLCLDFGNFPERFTKLYKVAFKTMGTLILPIVVFVSIYSPNILLFIFGQNFLPAARAFSIIIWVAYIRFLGSIMSPTLNAAGLQGFNLLFAVFGALLSFILNLILIPQYGIEGAAITMIVSSSGCGGLVYFISPKTRPFAFAYVGSSLRALMSAVAMGFILNHFKTLSFVFSLLVGMGLYCFFVFLLKGFDRDDWEALTANYFKENKDLPNSF